MCDHVISRSQGPQALWPAVDRQRGSRELGFYYRRISEVKQCKPLRSSQSKNLNEIPGAQCLLATSRWPKSLKTVYEIDRKDAQTGSSACSISAIRPGKEAGSD